MSLGNTPASFGTITKTFHWLTALLIFTIIPIGLIANGMADALRDPNIPSTNDDILRTAFLFSLHKTLGVTIFFVALARILWAISQPKPGLLNADKPLESLLAETIHWLLYGSLVLVPLSGWIHHAATVGFAPIWWPFGQSLPFVPKDQAISEIFAGLHMVLERVLVLALVLHIAGAIKHHVIDRDATLRRMLPGHIAAPLPAAHKRNLLPPVLAAVIWALALTLGNALGAFGGHAHDHATSHSNDAAPAQQIISDWQVTTGTLALDILQMGSTISGNFNDWIAAITFTDPKEPGPAGSVVVFVNIASLTLGTVSDQAMGPDFFDTQTYPTAHFDGTLTKTATGYVATGPLTIRDKQVPITLPFDLTVDGTTATMTGKLDLQRLDFDIGTSMPDENTLGFTVALSIALTATRAP